VGVVGRRTGSTSRKGVVDGVGMEVVVSLGDGMTMEEEKMESTPAPCPQKSLGQTDFSAVSEGPPPLARCRSRAGLWGLVLAATDRPLARVTIGDGVDSRSNEKFADRQSTHHRPSDGARAAHHTAKKKREIDGQIVCLSSLLHARSQCLISRCSTLQRRERHPYPYVH
jgi:hypothetical protein